MYNVSIVLYIIGTGHKEKTRKEGTLVRQYNDMTVMGTPQKTVERKQL